MPATRTVICLRQLMRERRGAAALESTLVSVPLGAPMAATLQTSLTFFAQQQLETSAEKSVCPLMIGQAQAANMTQARFNTLDCSKLPVFTKCSKVVIDVQQATTFSSASTAARARSMSRNSGTSGTVRRWHSASTCPTCRAARGCRSRPPYSKRSVISPGLYYEVTTDSDIPAAFAKSVFTAQLTT